MADTNPGLTQALDEARRKLIPQFAPPGAEVPGLTASVVGGRGIVPGISAGIPGNVSMRGVSGSNIPAAAPSSGAGVVSPGLPAGQETSSVNRESLQVPRQQPTAPTASQQELRRLTEGSTGRSGVSQIRNPFARVPLQILDAIGSTFAPALTSVLPGTEFHHQGLVNVARKNVQGEQEQAASEAGLRHLNAQTADLERGKLGPQGHTVETSEGIKQWNPATQRYDIDVGEAPGKEQQNVHVLPDGSVVAVHHDPKTGQSRAEVLFKGDPKVATHVIERQVAGKAHNILVNTQTGEDVKDLGEKGAAERHKTPEELAIDEYMQKNPGATVQEAREKTKIHPPQNPPQALMIDPATNQVVLLRPGQTAPAGGMSPTTMSGQNAPTAATRNVADQAASIREAGDRLIAEIDAKKGKVGNLGSYWKQFVNGTPISDPAAAGLMTSLSSFAALQPKLHGFRSEKAMEEFAKMIGGIPKDPEALKESIRSIQGTAGIIEKRGTLQRGGALPTVTTKEQFDQLPKGAEYMEDGKKYRKP